MSDSESPSEAGRATGLHLNSMLARVFALMLLLYAFLVSIGMLGKAFKMFSGGFVGSLIESASNP